MSVWLGFRRKHLQAADNFRWVGINQSQNRTCPLAGLVTHTNPAAAALKAIADTGNPCSVPTHAIPAMAIIDAARTGGKRSYRRLLKTTSDCRSGSSDPEAALGALDRRYHDRSV